MRVFAPLLLGAATVPAALGHTLFTNFFIDGTPIIPGKCLRMPSDREKATAPLPPDVSTKDMACGPQGEVGVDRVCAVKAGSVFTTEHKAWPDGQKDAGAIDVSHKGPCAIYMKKVDDASASNNAAGPGWFKIWQEDFDYGQGKFCTEKLNATDGRISVTIPSDIKGGHYLLRTELLALHAADKTPPDPQFYASCAQLFVQGTGTAEPKDTVSIPGHVSYANNHAALTFNIWQTDPQTGQPKYALPYPMFGPKPYESGAVSKRHIHTRHARAAAPNVPSASLFARATSQTTQTTGLVPPNCVFENDNWCGVELPDYTNEDGCWAASNNCYDQDKVCWAVAGPTGSANCAIWEAKCKRVQDACNAKQFTGPPDKGKVLTPAQPKGDVPAVRKSVGSYDGGSVGAQAAAPVAAAPQPEAPVAQPKVPVAAPAPKVDTNNYDTTCGKKVKRDERFRLHMRHWTLSIGREE